MTTTHAGAAPTRSPAGKLRQLGIDTQYVLLGFPIALVTLVLGLTGFAVGVSTAVIWIGLPLLAGTLMMSRGFAMAERARISPVLGRRIPQPIYRNSRGKGAFRRLVGPFTDGQYWLDLLHGVFRLVPNVLGFCFVLTWWAGTLSGLTWWLWGWTIPQGPNDQDLPGLLGLGSTYLNRSLFYLAMGVFFAGTLFWVVRWSALLEAKFAQGLLIGAYELRRQVTDAEEARDLARQQKAAAVSAEAVALRKLERDIHDGPQQRLVRLAMDLGRAEQKFADDPEHARALVAEALTQTRETLDELRALSRGIAPPILVDRGLQAALTALAGRCTVPVDLDAPPLERLDPGVESTAYFVVAEALTNVAKHSHANEVQVSVQRIATGLIVTVSDDGVGGASLAKGHGLAGLDDRVRAAGGVLAVDSREGEGTRLTAALPL
ncbi:sensor histidine kinase [Actinoplanes derwentensis]|uniref:histidine kinase n=1 Tax=Actinoplanes derwentensis TaxID=113562 RepID=A0A1H2CN88_9ACTN|nr:sensor histidine kinase [Actinoplanes derwentensis]GID88583.1 histidine kinase [Actinoplanes derwentensis]SDT71980.1 Signal transduction histidine kinase [Actinoplanes derwentensis]